MRVTTIPGIDIERRPISQLEWEIDPINGNDYFSGVPGDPIATFAELFRRLDLFRITQTITVTLLATTSEDVCARADFENNSFLRIISTPTIYCTGTITSSTAWNDSTKSEVYITVGSLSGGHTAAQLVGKIIRINAGARAGNWTVVSRNTTGSVLRCPGWSQPDFDLGTASVNDTFDVLEPVHASGLWTVVSSGSGRFWFENIEVGARGSHGVEVHGVISLVSAIANGCDSMPTGDVYAFGSYLGHGPKAQGHYTLDRTAAVRASGSPFESYENGTVLVYDQNIIDGYNFGAGAGSVTMIFGSLAVCNATEGVIATAGAQIVQTGYLWFRDNITRLIRAETGSRWAYASGRAPAHVGSTSPALGLLAGNTITGIPQTEAAGLAHIVVQA